MIGIIKRIIKLEIFKRRWRKINSNNYTRAKMLFNINDITVGNNSYGDLYIYQWGEKGEGLDIGDYVSIANDVKFILGGNHRYDTISTYPFKVKILGEKRETYTNGKIIIEDGVWIGMNSIIMSGVKIGKGAVIAAGSIVTKDVEPFSIVGGNPAKIIKYRFSEEIRLKLNEINSKDIPQKYIEDNIDLLYQSITIDIIDKIIGDINEFKK